MAMREDSLVLVTPTHKADFSEQERVNLELSIGFNSNLTHWFLVPDYLDTTKISQMFSKSKIKKMPGRFFESTKTYNNLMLSEVFYQEFLEYKYLLQILIFFHSLEYFLILLLYIFQILLIYTYNQ